MVESKGDNRTEVIAMLKEMAQRNEAKARLSLMGLLVVFVGSVSLFFFSDILAPGSSSKIDVVITEREIELNKDLQQVRDERLNAREQIADLVGDPQTPADKDLQTRLKELQGLEINIIKEISILARIKIEEALGADNVQIETIISVVVTRVGAVMLAVFMIQIFLSFYRYFTRVGNYYRAKVVAICSLRETDAKEIGDIVNSISPESIRFGKEPQMPFEKMVELLKAVRP